LTHYFGDFRKLLRDRSLGDPQGIGPENQSGRIGVSE
jgi:hypothetical protein